MEEAIQGLEDIEESKIYDDLYKFIEARIRDNCLDADVHDVYLHGSRIRHTAKPDSDLDVVVFYIGDEREDVMFEVLNEEPKMKIQNVEVDFNPIRPEETGTLEACIQRSEAYDKEVLSKLQESKEEVKQPKYEPPYDLEEIKAKYDKKTYEMLSKDPVHRWRAITGIELIHKEPSRDELDRIWLNWNLMTDEMKKLSDKKSIELFGVDNETHYLQLQDDCDYFKSKDFSQEDVDSWRSIQKMMY